MAPVFMNVISELKNALKVRKKIPCGPISDFVVHHIFQFKNSSKKKADLNYFVVPK